jgi:hypothetical protein
MATEVFVMLCLTVINDGDIHFRCMLIIGHGSADRMLIVTTSGEIMFIS